MTTSQERIDLEEMYEYYFYTCVITREQATQRAHIIGNTKMNRKKYGSHVIDHPANWLPVANLQANALVDLGGNEYAKAIVAGIIEGPQPLHAKRQAIKEIVLDNIARKKDKL